MNISYSKNFIKSSKLLKSNIRTRLLECIRLFSESPTHPTLRNHQLKGAYKDYRSIDITGDIRALYLQKESEVIFDQLGTHSQLYG
jgi:addiction module RelE/StbE family toxin